jgi:Cdc6-like AAA superfamily ATPase
LVQVRESEEFAKFVSDREGVETRIRLGLVRGLHERIDALLSAAEEDREIAEADRRSRLIADKRRLVQVRILAAFLVSFTIYAGGVELSYFSAPRAWGLVLSGARVTLIVVAALAAISLLYLAVSFSRVSAARDAEAQAEIQAKATQLQTRILNEVKEEFTRILNGVLSDRGLAVFPAKAPRLVELSITKAQVVSSAITRVSDFIQGHESSAIGIAGPRGVGKSTLMLKVAKLGEFGLSVVVAAPVEYERLDLLRRLARAIANAIVPGHLERQSLMRARVALWIRIANRLSVTIGVLGTAIAGAIAIQPDNFAGSTLLATVVAVGVAALVPQLAATIVPMRIRERADQSDAELLAASLLDDLHFQSEVSTTSKTTAKLTKLLQHEGSEATKLSSNQLGIVDVVDRLRRLLEVTAAEAGPEGRVIILIDELDKLPDADALIGTVNSIKDLMHLPGVHFVVSVSDEALASFQMRGIGARDAFDSTFDLIFEMPRLSLLESIDVLASRVAGFPRELTAFAHVWAGGLPRDLLRAARACVEINSSTPTTMPWPEMARSFLNADLRGRARAIVRNADDQAEQGQIARVLHSVCSLAGAGSERPPSTLPSMEGQRKDVLGLCALGACCAVAIDYIERSVADEQANAVLDELSGAVAGIADGRVGAIAAYELAQRLIKLPLK